MFVALFVAKEEQTLIILGSIIILPVLKKHSATHI